MKIANTYEEMVSAEWLTEALSERHPGTDVHEVKVTSVLHGVGTKAMLELSYAANPAGLPELLCAKAGWEDANTHLLQSGLYAREARFYADIASGLSLRTPRCYYSGVDDEAVQGILLLEDLVDAGVTFGSAERGFTVEEAARFMESLAELHAKHWNVDPATVEWLRNGSGSSGGAVDAIYTDKLQGNLDGSRADGLPAEMRDAERMIRGFMALRGHTDHGPQTIVHGDCHARNLFLDRDGSPGFFDFQTAHVDTWALDVAYLLGANLDHADRRRDVQSLVQHYLDSLASRGVAAPGWDEAWDSYRRCLIYGLFLWAITRPIVQPIEAITAFVDRLGNAAAEVDTYGALGV